MRWTTDKPIKAGEYWIKETHLHEQEIVRVNLDGSVRWFSGRRADVNDLRKAKWAGPIEEPEEEA